MNSKNAVQAKINKREKIAIVVPCYNEGKMLPITIPKLIKLLDGLKNNLHCAGDCFLVFVDDGSTDNTWPLIDEATKQYPGQVHGVCLCANVGHQGALLCGLEYVMDKCDAAVSMDADLQDDINVIPDMVNQFRRGSEIVLGVRNEREVDTWFKRTTAVGFYRFMRWMGVNLAENHADFRLMSLRSLKNLRQFSEVNLFLRGLPPLLHKKITTVSYQRAKREAGNSKYPLSRMVALAWNGITSFSIVPLRLIAIMGGGVFLLSFFLTLYVLVNLFLGKTVHGWASTVLPMYLMGGGIMFSLGIVGEYVGKVFLEVKRRPPYLIDRISATKDKNE